VDNLRKRKHAKSILHLRDNRRNRIFFKHEWSRRQEAHDVLSTKLAVSQPVANAAVPGAKPKKTSNRSRFAVRSNLNFVVQAHHAGNALATMDAKLPFVKRIHPAANGNNTLPRFDFDRSQPWKMLLCEEVHHTAFQISIRLVQHELVSDHRCTTWGFACHPLLARSNFRGAIHVPTLPWRPCGRSGNRLAYDSQRSRWPATNLSWRRLNPRIEDHEMSPWFEKSRR
jgi:hypothetical protein